MNKAQGLGLPELFVSLFLSSLIFALMMQLYSHQTRHNNDLKHQLDAAFDQMLVVDMIRDAAMHAGFTPCRGLDEMHVFDRRSNDVRLKSLEIQSKMPKTLSMKRMSGAYVKLDSLTGVQRITITTSFHHEHNKPLLISDCYRGEVHDVKNIRNFGNQTVIELNAPLKFHYPEGAYLGDFLEESWLFRNQNETGRILSFWSGQYEVISDEVDDIEFKRDQNKPLLDVRLTMNKGKTSTHQIYLRNMK